MNYFRDAKGTIVGYVSYIEPKCPVCKQTSLGSKDSDITVIAFKQNNVDLSWYSCGCVSLINVETAESRVIHYSQIENVYKRKKG